LKILKYLFYLAIFFVAFKSSAQNNSALKTKPDTVSGPVIDSSKQRDAIDVLKRIFFRNSPDTRKKSSPP